MCKVFYDVYNYYKDYISASECILENKKKLLFVSQKERKNTRSLGCLSICLSKPICSETIGMIKYTCKLVTWMDA